MNIKNALQSFFLGRIDYGRNFLLAVLVVVSAYVLFSQLNVNPLSTDGYYYANCSRLMVNNNDFITIWYNNVPDFTCGKGIFFYWMNAVSGMVFGFDSFSMRFPSAVLGFLCIMFMFFFLEKKYDHKFAFISSVILLFTQQFLYHSRTCYPDGNFAVFFTFTIITFYIAVTDKKPAYYYLFGFFLGISALTRQTLALFILPVITVYALSIPERKKIFFCRHFYLSLLLAALITAPWYISAYNKYGIFFINEYFATVLKVAAGNTSVSSPFTGGKWWGYLRILIENYEPWLIFLVIGSFTQIKRIIKQKDIFVPSFEKFVLIWAWLPFILFHVMKGYQTHFIVPLYIPFAVISAWGVLFVFNKHRNAVISYLLAISFAVAMLCFFAGLLPRSMDNRHYIDTVKILPEMMKIKEQIYTTDEELFYSNILLFHCDRNVKKVTPEEFDKMMKSDKEYYFVMRKKHFKNRAEGKYDSVIISKSDKDFLFSNKMRLD